MMKMTVSHIARHQVTSKVLDISAPVPPIHHDIPVRQAQVLIGGDDVIGDNNGYDDDNGDEDDDYDGGDNDDDADADDMLTIPLRYVHKVFVWILLKKKKKKKSFLVATGKLTIQTLLLVSFWAI